MILTFELSRNVEELEFYPALQAKILVNQVYKDTWLVIAHTVDIKAKIICILEASWLDRHKECDYL